MATPTSIELVKGFLNKKSKHGKSILFNYENGYMYMGQLELAKKLNNIILINDTVDFVNANALISELIKKAPKSYYKIVRVPFNLGEEKMPTNEEIRERLKRRLHYYLYHKAELSLQSNREQYKAYFEEFNVFIKETHQSRIPKSLKDLYNSLNDKKFIKALELDMARRNQYHK